MKRSILQTASNATVVDEGSCKAWHLGVHPGEGRWKVCYLSLAREEQTWNDSEKPHICTSMKTQTSSHADTFSGTFPVSSI